MATRVLPILQRLNRQVARKDKLNKKIKDVEESELVG